MSAALFGRLHPLLVHLPIGFLVMAFLLDLLSKFKGYRKVRVAVAPVLFWGALAAIVSAISGYLLSQEGGYDEQILNLHQKGGIATAVLAFVTYVQRRYSFSLTKPVKRSVSTILITSLVILMTLTGHQGGTLTHGEGFLSPGVMMEVDSARKVIRYQGPPAEAKVYEDIIRPLLDEKCVGCHGPNKQKGKLRLDGLKWMMTGGKHGHLLDQDKSELFRRISLPVEEKEHMPPRAKAQLTSTEIDLLKAWIDEGSSAGKSVADYNDQRIFISWLAQAGEETPEYLIPEVLAANPATIDQLKASGVVVVPVAVRSNALEINLSHLKNIPEEVKEQVRSLSRQVVRLRLSGCTIDDADMSWVSRLTELRVLFLDHTGVTDAGVGQLKALQHLDLLNLADTKTTENVLSELSGFPALRKVFLFGTKVPAAAMKEFQAGHPKVMLDTGNVQLERIAADTVVYRK